MKNSNIQLEDIHLVQSNFRKGKLNESFDTKDFQLEINSFPNKTTSGVEVEVKVTLKTEDFPEFCTEVTMLGIFKIEGEIKFPLDYFNKVNAPAIIYPYIRQHVRNLSIEAGLDPVILPIVNFVASYNENKEENN